MANLIAEFDPITHITVGAVGEPGHRTFFLQAERGREQITLLCEKEQVAALADAIDELAQNLEEEFGVMRHAGLVVDAAVMALKEPVDPSFRIGALGLGYDAGRDRVLLVAQDAAEAQGAAEALEVRFFATRSQMQALSSHARTVIGQSRPPEQEARQTEAYARRNGHGH